MTDHCHADSDGVDVRAVVRNIFCKSMVNAWERLLNVYIMQLTNLRRAT